MKKISMIAMVFLLAASLLTGCRRPDTSTTGATDSHPSSSSSAVRPEPTITMPDSSSGNTSRGVLDGMS